MINSRLIIFLCLGIGLILFSTLWRNEPLGKTNEINYNGVKSSDNNSSSADSLHVVGGFIAEGDYLLAIKHCTSCHAAELVVQNRASREGWEQLIRWMQRTQKLWDLGEDEDAVLNYLATYYAPKDIGRRANVQLSSSDWYYIE